MHSVSFVLQACTKFYKYNKKLYLLLEEVLLGPVPPAFVLEIPRTRPRMNHVMNPRGLSE